MKKLLLVFAATTTFAHAELQEANMKVMCGPTLEIVRILVNQYNEQPILVGRSDTLDAEVSIWLNPTTRSFTIVKSNSTNACQLDAGKNLSAVKNSK